eukprot:UN03174
MINNKNHPQHHNVRAVASGVKKYMRRRAYNLLSKDPYFKLLFTRLAEEKAAMMNNKNTTNNNNTHDSTAVNHTIVLPTNNTTTVVDTTSPSTKEVVETNVTITPAKKNKRKHRKQRKQKQHNHKLVEQEGVVQQPSTTNLYNVIDGLFAKYQQQFDK